ncbi:nuclear transport factor 2 family protein [Deinococcus psychrotolerans]|uniref:Nuclear transport factor 2 family protein n=1 Tax=Deinococcus psychrotolerans TaxID=2489213 RepID=A0A3G8YCK6_9DEIO|nr:nuclear transport factor 2 family protein [Deinococcus psychrotolerans]AZI42653.1 nuclear transport factor 2 family protein [Deinococcus psychrotolerans]
MDADTLPALAEVLALDDAWNRGYQSRDVGLLGGVLADDWLALFADGGVTTKLQLLAGVPSNPEAALSFERQTAQLYGDTAVVRGSLTANGQYVQSFLRIYARRAGRWQAVAVQVVP